MSKHLIPRVALVDPVLTMSAPGKVAASAGFDALAHAVESYTSLRANPLTELFSLEAIRLVGKALRAAVNDRSDLGANSEMALASLYAGIGMANAGTCAAHALAYPLGTRFHVPHGVSVAMVLASAVAYNAPASVAKHARVAEALGVITRGLSAKEAAEAASSACRQLANDIGLPTTMREFGLVEEEIERLAEEAMSITRLVINNPRPLSASHAASIYRSML
jgi:alcohol dehydrogenase